MLFFIHIAKKIKENSSLSGEDILIIDQVVGERINFVYGDDHGVGYILDPKYFGKDMDYETKEQVEFFIYNYFGEGEFSNMVVELSNYYFFCENQRTSTKMALYLEGHLPLINF